MTKSVTKMAEPMNQPGHFETDQVQPGQSGLTTAQVDSPTENMSTGQVPPSSRFRSIGILRYLWRGCYRAWMSFDTVLKVSC